MNNAFSVGDPPSAFPFAINVGLWLPGQSVSVQTYSQDGIETTPSTPISLANGVWSTTTPSLPPLGMAIYLLTGE